MATSVVSGLEVNIFVGSIGVLDKAVSRGVFQNEGEREMAAVNIVLDLEDKLVDLSGSGRVVLSSLLLQVFKTFHCLCEEAFNSVD